MSHSEETRCSAGSARPRRVRRPAGIAILGVVFVSLLAWSALKPGVAGGQPTLRIEDDGQVAGTAITLRGSGFGVGENVNLTVTHADGGAEAGMGHEPWTIIAPDGTFTTTWSISPADDRGDRFVATAVGGLSGATHPVNFGRMVVVATDKFDYAPGETATIAGAGFRAGEDVTLQVVHTRGATDGGAGHDPWTVTADASGTISAAWFVNPDDSAGAEFLLHARGARSGLAAAWAFMDAVCQNPPPPDPVVPLDMPGVACPTNLNSCTANDVVTAVIAATPVDGDVCGSATDTLTLDFTVQFATTANQRYDLGFYISEDGLSIPGHTALACAGSAPQVGDGDGNADLADCDSDLFLDLDPTGHKAGDPDTCGDLQNNAGPVRMTFRATVACDHLDANHNLLVPSCRVWEQNANHDTACTSLAQAGTGSKCDCTDLSFAGVLDPCVTAFCDDSNACTADSCDSSSGQAVCKHDPVSNGTSCDDASACTIGETCQSGTCTGGTAPDCDDHNACTDDRCDATTGCTHTNNTASCDDGNFCDGTDTCSGGQCTHSGDPCGAGQVCDGNGGVCVQCLSDGDCHDPNAPFCDAGHVCVQCLTDSNCDDHNACNGAETCVGNTCHAGTPPNCDDHNACTDDRCDATTGCTHTNNTASCDDGNFCDGTDTCSGGQCTHSGDPCGAGQVCDGNGGVCVQCLSDGDCHDGGRPFCGPGNTCVQCLTDSNCDDHNACTGTETCQAGLCALGQAPDCNDNNPCTTDACDPAGGCTHTTVSGGQDGSCQTVTDTSFCPLPPDPTCGAGTFRLIDLQNPTAGPSGSIVRNDYLLNASNPGQWYYNVFYSGTPGSSFSLTIDVPWPFITQGAVPIQIHDGTGLSGGCYAPNASLPGFTITTDGGNVSAGGSPVILLNDYKMQNLGDTTAVYVSGSVPSTGMAYVTIHLDYGVKKLSGWQQAPDFTTLQGPDTNLDGSLDGLGDGPIYIKGGTPACTAGQDYAFDFNSGGPTLGSTVYSINTFKKNPGVNGLLLKSSGSGKANVRVEFWGPTGKLIASTTTDADGFYMFTYKATGKPSTYTIKVPALGLQKTTTLKANGYALVTFENVP